MEIQVRDVVRLVSEFLAEIGLDNSWRALEQESSVRLNQVRCTKQQLEEFVVQGKWKNVLQALEHCELPHQVAWSLYEEIVQDMVKDDIAGNIVLAKQLLRGGSSELEALKQEDGARFDRLQDIVYNKFKRVKRGEDEIRRARHGLAEDIAKVVNEAGASSKLLELLGNAIQWRKERGENCDLFSSAAKKRKHDQAFASSSSSSSSSRSILLPLQKKGQVIKFAKGCIVHVVTFLGSNSIVTGTSDGFIEIWNAHTGKLRKDLEYQAQDNIMMHKKDVLGLAVSPDEQTLVSTSLDGMIKVWSISNGKCKTRIKRAHLGKPINCVAFSKKGDKILSGGNDHSARLFGASSGTMLLELRGHTGPVTTVSFLGKSCVVTGSSDHDVKLWDAKTGEILASKTFDAPINFVVPYIDDILLVTTRSGSFSHIKLLEGGRQIGESGKVSCPNGNSRFVTLGVVPKSPIIYGAAEDGNVYIFTCLDDKRPKSFSAEHEMVGMKVEPGASALATFGENVVALFTK